MTHEQPTWCNVYGWNKPTDHVCTSGVGAAYCIPVVDDGCGECGGDHDCAHAAIATYFTAEQPTAG